MSPFRRLAVVAGVFAVLLVPLVARSGEAEDERARDAKPGPNHERLAALAGEWDVTTDPGGPKGEEWKGAATIRSILGGRFIVEEWTGTKSGEPFTAWQMTGFNNLSNAYEATWTYTGSSGQMHLSGPANADGTKFTMAGGIARAGGETKRYEVTVEFSGPDRFLVTVSRPVDRGNWEVDWVSTYVRKK